ncbi:hypothetical protein HDU67_004862, partial [Dinochytrium kinnereticum]
MLGPSSRPITAVAAAACTHPHAAPLQAVKRHLHSHQHSHLSSSTRTRSHRPHHHLVSSFHSSARTRSTVSTVLNPLGNVGERVVEEVEAKSGGRKEDGVVKEVGEVGSLKVESTAGTVDVEATAELANPIKPSPSTIKPLSLTKPKRMKKTPIQSFLATLTSSTTPTTQTTTALTLEAQNLLSTYPWLLSTLPPRPHHLNEPPPSPSTIPTFWSTLKHRHLLHLGTARAKQALHDPAYEFPHDFQKDAGKVVRRLLAVLSDPEKGGDVDALKEVMMGRLAQRFADGFQELNGRGRRVVFEIEERETVGVKVSSLYFTYGPYPVPEGYVAQSWLGLFTIMIPREDAQFISHPHQKRVLRAAEEDGVYFKVRCHVDARIVMTVIDCATGKPV